MAIQRLRLDVEMIDGTTYLGLMPTIADRMRFSRTRHKHGWPSMTEDQDWAAIFMAWSVIERDGRFVGTFAEFEKSCATVTADDGVEEVDPTNPAPSVD